MSFFQLFVWWRNATPGTLLSTWLHGNRVGADKFGNRYYQSKDAKRRWVIYAGTVDASRVPPEGGRAAVRGAWIRDHREMDWRGDWQFVWQPSSGLCVDLRDPFDGAQREVQLKLPAGEEAWHVDVLDLLQEPRVVSA